MARYYPSHLVESEFLVSTRFFQVGINGSNAASYFTKVNGIFTDLTLRCLFTFFRLIPRVDVLEVKAMVLKLCFRNLAFMRIMPFYDIKRFHHRIIPFFDKIFVLGNAIGPIFSYIAREFFPFTGAAFLRAFSMSSNLILSKYCLRCCAASWFSRTPLISSASKRFII